MHDAVADQHRIAFRAAVDPARALDIHAKRLGIAAIGIGQHLDPGGGRAGVAGPCAGHEGIVDGDEMTRDTPRSRNLSAFFTKLGICAFEQVGV